MAAPLVSNDSLIGKTLGHYRIVGQLGAGGMGVVYRAEDTKLGRQVAVKVLPTGSAAGHEAVERFRREARTASSLNHPNICTIYGFDEQDDQLYLAMELLDGEPLDRRLSGRPLDLRAVLDIGTQVADALDAAHVGGILHRDIKPANIFITRRGQVKVLDFGLAKLAPDFRRPGHAHQTQAADHFSSVVGTTVGTIAYMSPEQARGEDVDQRTDLFSFGVVLYEMVTGTQTFPGHTTAVVFDGILNREPAPPSALNANIPSEFDRIITKALEKDRALRYQTAADMGADLKRLRRDSGSRQVLVPPSLQPDTATVVLPQGTPPGSASAMHTSVYASLAEAQASAPTMVQSPGHGPRPAPPPASSSALPVAAKTSWLVMAGIAIVVVAALAGGVGAYLANRGSTPAQEDSANATGPTADTPPANQAPAEPAVQPTANGAAAKPPAPPTAPAAKVAAAKPASPPPAPSRESEAQQRLDVARAKMANDLNDQALGDLQSILQDFPGSRVAAEASFLAAEVLEKLGKVDDAMAAHVEFESRFSSDRRVAESKLRRALMLAGQRQPMKARELLNEIAQEYPGTPQAWQALQAKRRFESERRNAREFDPVLKTQLPPVVLTMRQIIEQFPKEPQSMPVYLQLASAYQDLNRHAEAAKVLESLATNFPDNPLDVWFRLGEIYDRRLNDDVKAKEAYAKVPAGSPRYNEAQKRLNRK